MVYKVSLTAPAEADVQAAFEHIQAQAPARAERWLTGLFQAIYSLSEMPERCPLIPESPALGLPIRHRLYGKRSAAYRIIFDIWEDPTEGPTVRVLRIWHGSRDRLRIEDLA